MPQIPFDINTGNYDPSELNGGSHNMPTLDDITEAPAAPEESPKPTRRKAQPKPEAKKPTQQRHPADKRGSFFGDGRFVKFIGITLIVIAGILLMSFISFIAYGAEDQSIVVNNSLAQMTERSLEVKNDIGPLGAFLANTFISRWFGIGSFALIYYIFALALHLLKIHKFKFWDLTFKCFATTIAVSIITGFITFHRGDYVFWGGAQGYFVNDYLIKLSTFWGALAVNVLLMAGLILIFINYIKKIWRTAAKYIRAHKEKMAERYQEAVDKNQQARRKAEAKLAENQPKAVEVVDTVEEPRSIEPAIVVTPSADEESAIPDLIIPDEPANITSEEELAPKTADEQPTDDVSITITQGQIEQAENTQNDTYDPTAELSRYRFPTLDLLHEVTNSGRNVDIEEQEENKKRIIQALKTYNVEISHIEATVGPTITLYEIIPAAGVRIAKIKRLGDDMAMSLSALGIRIIAPMPGKGTIGMEVPNKNPQTVSIRSILSSKAFQETKADLPMAMGTTISNEVFIADLCKMPHLLVAGATGMGKSVGLNTIIASLLYKKHPAELKFVLVDPKMVEFSLYKCLERHYLAKLPEEEDAIITEPDKVKATLNSLCIEMDNRYKLLMNAGVRDLKEYNKKFVNRRLNPEKGHKYLPYIVVIIDEFSDLIMQAGKEIENPIARIAQKARAVGIHLILATQRPSVQVITGNIKINVPGRIAFRVTQSVDSRTIIDRVGAEQLVGRGDMLFSRNGIIDRVQCAFIDTDEVQKICDYISTQVGYSSAFELPEYTPAGEGSGSVGNITDRDPLFYDAGRTIIESGVGSTSNLQRKYNIGYPRAGKIMDQLESAGVVGPAMGGKPRQVLMDLMTFDQAFQE